MSKIQKKLISVIIPTHNEFENIKPLYLKLKTIFEQLNKYTFEVIFCDDSSDKTCEEIKKIIKSDNRINLITLTRSFGQCNAIAAGIEYSNGDALIFIDADLQDPPKTIIELLRQWELGFYVVVVKRKSEIKSHFYYIFSRIFYYIQNKISDIDIPKNAGEFRLIDKKVAKFISELPESSRYIRGLTIWPGYRWKTIEIQRNERKYGKTNYNFYRSFENALEGFFSFSSVPLRISLVIGFIMSFLSFCLIVYALLLKFFTDDWVSGWSLVFITMTFFFGILFVCCII